MKIKIKITRRLKKKKQTFYVNAVETSKTAKAINN